MRQILRSAFFTIALVVLALWAMMPPEKSLRLGKDLRGGVSLTYSVQIDRTEDAQAVMTRLIDQLKRRVDPDGLMEISMVAQGRDRLEITMPLPGERVKALRKQFEDALAELGRNRLSPDRLNRVMLLPPAERDAEIATLAGENEARKARFVQAAQAFDRAQAARAQFDAATDPAERDRLVLEVAEAENAYAEARDGVLASALTAAEVRKIVQASTRGRFIDDAGQRVQLPSPREVAESQVRAAHPESSAELDRLLALHTAYVAERTTLDDPQDLMRLLRGAGVLSFRITVRPGEHPEEQRLREELARVGPRNVRSTSGDVRWYRVNQVENWIDTKAEADILKEDPRAASALFQRMGYVAEAYGGDVYMLAYDTRTTRLTQAEGTWAVSNAFQGSDQRGRPAINFAMNPAGAALLSRLTGEHLGEGMAILLDDEVYTAPTLQGQIGVSGQITGNFPPDELQYIIRVLSGGSLQAKLSPEPLSINSVGPELGFDNLMRGLNSGVMAAILVAVFMCFYYFFYGFVAVIALAVNAVLIIGAMALSKAAFTMPGIAGIILTFGMAVDSNVLVYERIREELNRGADMKNAVRLGFDRALSSIIDGNMTNLIVCVVLYWTGTPEIRGFAITMGIGVISTLIATLVASRLVFNIMLALGWKRGSIVPTSMLPMAVPGLQKLLTPNIDWIRLRYVFFGISAVYVLLGIGMIGYQGSKMLDNEFRGGTQITLQFRPDGQDGRVTMTRPEVEDRVRAIASEAPEGDRLRELAFAEVFPIDPQADGVTSDQFSIKTTAQNAGNVVLDAVKARFTDVLEAKPGLEFASFDQAEARRAPAFPIEKPVLGEAIGRAGLRQDVSGFLGGVAIVLENITPTPTVESLRTRLASTRSGENYSDTLSRRVDVLVLEGDEEAVRSAVVLVADETASIFDNEAAWESEVRDREWALVQEALTQDTTPASVVTFSPTIAETFRANAITATILSFIFIGIYIWVRFSTPRYSIAAVIALVHDVLTVIGFVALAEILYESKATHDIAVSLGLLPFKIDLNMVAALLTIAGYSLNDTVVIMDRIRENRGKLQHATKDIINLSINQTFSRTVITGGTTLGSCFILYVWGGEGMRAFAFALATGLIVGTYSSVAVAAPIVWSRKHEEQQRREAGIIETRQPAA